jgi:hypothetical protein
MGEWLDGGASVSLKASGAPRSSLSSPEIKLLICVHLRSFADEFFFLACPAP